MTLDEFKNTKFSPNMYAKYMGNEYYIVSVNFEESIFGLGDKDIDDGFDLIWVRCENMSLIG